MNSDDYTYDPEAHPDMRSVCKICLGHEDRIWHRFMDHRGRLTRTLVREWMCDECAASEAERVEALYDKWTKKK